MGTGRLPNLLVVGVPKAGTGSLFAYLGQHPDICPSDEKEVGYFNHFNPARNPDQPPPPLEQYSRHFSHCAGQRYAMEATPSYSYQGKPVVDAIQEVLNQPKIIISLRDPVDRLWSAYTFQRSLGNIAGVGSFAEYLRICQARREDGSDLVPHSAVHGLSIGFYADYLGDWLAAFGEDVKVVFAEDMARQPASVLAGLFEWLSLDTSVLPTMDFGARNVTKHPRNPKVARAVFTMKRHADRMHLLPPRLREQFRRGYVRMNAGSLSERLDPAARSHSEDIYRSSTVATARMLAEHGYRDLPSWLTAGRG